ncbi:type IV-A pilus assembly ATPase PilB [Moraxella sp. K1664]|uniref:Type IV-A pilus assembly ATPase PilB n=1 Tax=Moraxella lacunata TaxID=477 RepID=A0A1B8Q865_MORLA|nr:MULTISPECIES: type IV-A pilus assembly ATPase PilB [Moraxella]MBE9579925.1 type IV-A pilus assembly ATPase PilB [Moraxella sp. K1664]MBE9589312.1 type IV-A pilus assembly ATPase PilB [Moraxella sp. K1630]MDH9220070.1 type IV-A pilus assembly ATPase PilB [Moraxella lacunata]MDI4484082.1 type IV-A pilus assembly ATPase PilB [Moraxella lacunata]MDI4508539.1 type IV-A pilus assembly ATPase PilB [Moraxella lacunata]
MSAPNFGGLAHILVSNELVAPDAMTKALTEAQQQNMAIVPYLVQNKVAPANKIASLLAHEFGDPLLDLNALSQDSIPKDLVDEKIINQYGALPLFKRGNKLFVGLSDPTRLDAIDAISFNAKLTVETIVIEEDKLKKMIENVYSGSGGLGDLGDVDLSGDFDGGAGDEDDEGTDVNSGGGEDAPVVKFVNKMLLDAIRMGASDLHFEPYEKSYRVRFRVDGVLQIINRPPVQLAGKIAARLKVMSQMDISERRAPQDGRIKLKISKTKAIDFRVNSCPTLFGEKLVLRILDPSSAMLGIDALGYEPDQKELFLEALDKPQGMLLITGPTGSGKTVSLYTGLNILNTPETNISTAEDPVEINLEGINQVNVNPKVGLTFASALKAFLRQDPDIVMVGEIRDLETAEIAIKAAQTGHMVLSTLHTNSAPETLTRLRNMGVASFNIATSVNLVIAQRLARRLCKSCKRPTNVPKQSLLEMGFTEEDLANPDNVIYEPVGCSECREGYKGRVGIYEVMKIYPSISRIIMEDGNAIQIKDEAMKHGFRDLRRSGIMKVLQGTTSIQEMYRVTSE